MGLSNLGIFHTLIGLIAIVAAIISYVRFGKINLANVTGKIYLYGTLVASLSTLGLSKLGGFNPGHVFALLIVIIVLIAYYLHTKKQGYNKARYYENILLSFSFFLSWLPTVVETFTRVPVGHPLAKDPRAPIILKTILFLFLSFIAGSIYQFVQQRKINRKFSS